jgi:hypothetical protein
MGKWMKHLLQYYIYIFIFIIITIIIINIIIVLIYNDLYYTLNFELCREHVSSELPDWHRCQATSSEIRQLSIQPTNCTSPCLNREGCLGPGCRRTGDTSYVNFHEAQ